MEKYTPGPWTAFLRKKVDMGTRDMPYHIGNADVKHTVAEAIEEANANLIAAAPEMYEALKRLEWSGEYETWPGCPTCGASVRLGDDGSNPRGKHFTDCSLAAALAKAEGRE